MGDVYEAGVERLIQNGGLISIGNPQNGLTIDGSAFAAYDFQVTGGSNSNPKTRSMIAGRDGSRLFGSSYIWGKWTADGQQTVGAVDIRLPNGSGGWKNFLRIDGNDLPDTINDAEEVTADITSTKGTVDFVRPGLAEIMVQGESGTTPYYVLLDNGSILASKDASATVAWDYSSGSNEFSQSSDVTFNNSSGGSWNVTAIEVREGSNSGPAIMRDDSISATVGNGGSITFTDITLSLSGLT